jgi:anti-sigma B factor antagonist
VIGATQFQISSEPEADGQRLRLSGELDIATAPQLEAAVASALARGARRLVIDLSGLQFIDSSGLRLCIVLSDRAVNEGWTLRLVRPVGAPLSVFQMTGAEQYLPFGEDAAAR